MARIVIIEETANATGLAGDTLVVSTVSDKKTTLNSGLTRLDLKLSLKVSHGVGGHIIAVMREELMDQHVYLLGYSIKNDIIRLHLLNEGDAISLDENTPLVNVKMVETIKYRQSPRRTAKPVFSKKDEAAQNTQKAIDGLLNLGSEEKPKKKRGRKKKSD